jgi:PAS domain S-box-containing protein
VTTVKQENTADTIKRLQGCISDLTSVLALPALWTGNEPSQIINTLLDGLVGMLRLDFAYGRLSNGPPVEVLRLAQRQTPLTPPEEIGRALNPWLTGSPHDAPISIPNPIGAGEVLIAPLGLGFHDEIGVVVAASRRRDFPTTIETLLLRVAANQAAIGLHEARLLGQQKHTAMQLEQQVAERTRQLTALNLELLGEITERDRAEAELRQLAALVETSTDFIGVSSLDGRALFLNAAGQRMVGLEGNGQVRTTTIGDYVVEQERDRFEREVLPAVFRDGRWEGEIQLKHFKTGAVIPMLHHLFFIKEQGTDRRIAMATVSRDITVRKQAEEALRASEERFRRYFELGLIGMAMTSPIKGCLEVNDELCRILGYERSELLHKNWTEMTHPDDLAEDLANFDRVMAGEIDGYSMDKRWIRKDGQVVHTIMAAKCVRKADGSVDYFVGLVQDITKRKQSEELLQKAHERLDLVLNSITEQFFGLSKDWRFNYLNKHAAEQMKLLGKDPEKLIGKVLWDEFDDVPNEEALRRVMEERAVITEEFLYTPLGEWVENHMYPSNDGGLVTFQKYVTQRKRAEKSLLESERRFSVMFNKAPFAIALARLPEGFIVDINEAWMKLFGFTRKEVVGKTTAELGINRDSDVRARLYAELQQRGSLRNVEMTVFTKSGDERLLACNMDVIGFGDNEYLLSTINDITEHRRADEALRQAHAELAHVNRVLTVGELTASIAHEVNQPLGAIVTNGNASLRLLSRDAADLEGTREAIECMISDAMRASEVIKRIRTLLRKVPPEKRSLNIDDTIKEVIGLTAGQLTRNQVAVHTELEFSPPVLGDRIQLQQVLLNLILNSNEAMSVPGWEPRELVITSQQTGLDEVMVTVRDTGIGLAPKNQGRVFDAFFTSKKDGLGLGLSISRTIIEAHGGRLWCTPNADRGATFQFTLPSEAGG